MYVRTMRSPSSWSTRTESLGSISPNAEKGISRRPLLLMSSALITLRASFARFPISLLCVETLFSIEARDSFAFGLNFLNVRLIGGSSGTRCSIERIPSVHRRGYGRTASRGRTSELRVGP